MFNLHFPELVKRTNDKTMKRNLKSQGTIRQLNQTLAPASKIKKKLSESYNELNSTFFPFNKSWFQIFC